MKTEQGLLRRSDSRHGLYGVAAGSVRRWLDRSPRRAEAVGGTSGLLMIGLGLRQAFTGRHD